MGYVNAMSHSNVLFVVCHRNGDVFLLLTAMSFNSPFFLRFFSREGLDFLSIRSRPMRRLATVGWVHPGRISTNTDYNEPWGVTANVGDFFLVFSKKCVFLIDRSTTKLWGGIDF